MWANSVWGFFGLGITLGLAGLSLPQSYFWLQPYFAFGAIGAGIASVLTFCWPVVRRKSLLLRAADRVEGWSVSARIGTLGALPQDKTLFFQKFRLVNVSSIQTRILDVVIHLKIIFSRTDLALAHRSSPVFDPGRLFDS
jgi:hypothetical protein